MPSSRNGGNIKFGIDFEANQASLNKLKKSLQDLQKIKFDGSFDGNRQEFNEVKARITEIQNLMKTAFNPTLNTSNITAFKNELEKSGMSLKQIQSDFSRFGSTGDRAFNQLATSVLTTNLKLKETNSLIDNMGKTMINTVKWGIASSVMNTFTQSVQGAFQYVQSLEKSLTNIRIVTGDSTEKMAQFAEQANRSAQALGRSTLDYTKASLTYYQQGLNAEDVQARTEATLKAQNITGAGSQMADYLTSVWNGYKVANEEAELYVDKLAAVADSSASDMSQLAIAMSKVASTANTMGVDVDQLNAQIATVVATTRQAPEAVGTAFKTIYTRMNDIKTGSDEAEISLGNYSGKMAELGFNVLDATGHLRDAGQVMEEIGGRWKDLTREQQIYLAQTMGGQRQVNQLMALFDNWTTYSELLNTSLESEGTLAEKNARYMESLGAKMEQLGAAGERVKDALIDSDSMKTVIEALTSVTNLVANLFETMGSGQTILLAFGSTITQLFSGTIAKEINSVITNMQNMKTNAQTIRNQLEMTKMVQQVGKDTPGGTVVADRLADIQKYYSVMDEASINNQKNLIAERGQLQNQIQIIKEEQKTVIDLTNAFKQGQVGKEDFVDANNFGPLNTAIGETQEKLQNVKDLFSKNLFENWNNIENIEDAQKLVEAVKAFQAEYEKIDPTKAKQLLNDLNKLNSGQMSGQSFGQKLQEYLASADTQAKKLADTINNSAQALSNAEGKASSLDKALKQNVDSAKQLFDVTNAVKMISAIGQISSSLMTINNLGSIWKNEDISASEKILKTVTTFGFLILSIITSMKNISSAMSITQALAQRRLIIEKAITAEKEKQAAINKREALIKELQGLKEKGETSKEVIESYKEKIKSTNDLIERTSQTAIKAEHEAGKVGSTFSTAFGAAKTSVAGFLTQLGMIAPYVIAIGAIVGIGYSIYAAYNSASIAAEKAAKNAAQTKRKYDQLKESYKNLTSALEDYHEAESALSKLVKGTEEWYDQVNLLNDKVLELLQHYPELAKYATMNQDGLLSISKEGQAEIKKQQRQRVYTAGIANADLQQQSYQANRRSQITNMGRNLYGLFGGPEVLSKIIEQVEAKGEGILGDEKRLEEDLGLNSQQIAVTQKNTKAILGLIHSLDAEKTKVDAFTDTLVRTNLSNEKEYKQSKNKEAFIDIYTRAIEQAKRELGEQYYKTESDGQGNNYQVLNRQKVIEDYERLKGTDIKQGFFGGLSEKDAEGNYQKTTFEAIQAYVRASEANIDAAKLLQQAANRMTQAEKDFANEDDRTKDLLFNSGLARGFDQVNKDTLSENDINKLESLNQQDLAEYLDIPIEDLSEKFKELRENVQDGLNNFIDGIEEQDTKAVMIKLKEQFGQNLSKNLAESIAQNVQDGYQKAGTKSGNTIRDFYEKLQGDQIGSLTKLTSEYNFAGNSAENFTKAIREMGVTSEQISDSMVKSFYDAQLKIQDIQVKENRSDPGKINAANSTLSLGTQLDSTGKLTDKELESYKSGLKEILKIYPQLSKEITTLNNIQLAGTSAYESALNKVKIALMSSYTAMAQMGKISEEDFSLQLKTLITNTELLQDVMHSGIITNTQASEILQNIASQYESCKNELAKYNTELATGTQQSVNAAASSLLLATRSAENGAQYGIEAQRISTLANRYRELDKEGIEAYQGMQENSKLAVDAATRYIRLNDAIETLQKDYTKVAETLQALQKYDISEVLGDADYSKTYQEIKKAVEDIIGIEQDLLDDNFIKQHAQEIAQAANGSEEAIIALQNAATEDIWVNINLDDSKFQEIVNMDKEEFANWINNLPEGELSVDDTEMLSALANALLEAGYTVDEIQRRFEGAHLNVDMDTSGIIEGANEVIQATQNMAFNSETDSSSQVQTDEKETGGYELIPEDVPGHIEVPLFQEAVTPMGVIPQFMGMDSRPFSYTQMTSRPQVEKQEVSNVNTATGLKIIRANKAPVGGQVSHKNRNGGNKKNSGGKGGGGKGGKGGSGKAKEPNKAKPATSKPDRYRNNTVKANNLANSMTKLQKAQERLTGKDALDNLQKQLQILQKQNRTINERIRLQKDEQAELKNALKKYGAAFNEEGTLTNYNATYSKIIDEYNKVITKWNSMSADQQEKNKDMVNNAKQIMDKALDNLKRYDALQQEQAKSIQDRIDNAQAQIDNKVKQFELKIEASLDLSQAKRDWNKFRRDFIEEIRDDDILGLNRYNLADLNSFFNKAQTGSLQVLSDKLHNIMGAPQNSGIFSADYLSSSLKQMNLTDRQAWLKQITDVSDNMVEELENLKSVADEVKESIFDMIDAVGEAFDEQMDEYEFLGDVLDHNMKVIELMYGDKAYDKMSKYYDSIAENNNKQLDFLSQTRDMWYGRMMEQKYRMNQLAAEQGTDSIAYKEAEERFKRYQKEWIDSVKNLNGALEDALQNLQARFQNTINNILVGFEKELSGGRLLDDVADEWDMLNDKAETYLDTINAAYEVDKLENAFQDAINGVDGDLAAQQSLTDLMEQQVNYLRDKEKLTQYDVDRANALLQIEVKRLALEQARSNKNRLRLRRDSQGNYTYQYTADSQSINKAQQELADAQNSLYNLNKNAYNDNLNSIQKTAQELEEKVRDIMTDTNLTYEDRLKKRYELEKYYGAKINDLLKENAVIRQNLMDSAFKEIAKQRGISEEEIRAMSKEQQNALFKELVPQSDSYLAQMVGNMMDEGGFSKFFNQLFTKYEAAAAQNRKQQEELEKNARVNFEDITENTDILVEQIEKLLEPNKELVDLQKNQLQETQAQINYLNAELAYWSAIVDKVKDLVSTVSYLRQGQDLQLLGFNQATDRKVAQAESTAIKKATKEGKSASDLDKNYKPYVPEWTGSDWTAMFGSFTGDEMDVYRQNAKTTAAEYADNETTKQAVNNYAFPNVITDMGNVFDSINSNVLSINDTLNSLISQNKDYQTAMLAQVKATEEAITSQIINVSADFPNAKDVTSIIRAIEDLPLAFAQSMGKKTEVMKGHGSKKK